MEPSLCRRHGLEDHQSPVVWLLTLRVLGNGCCGAGALVRHTDSSIVCAPRQLYYRQDRLPNAFRVAKHKCSHVYGRVRTCFSVISWSTFSSAAVAIARVHSSCNDASRQQNAEIPVQQKWHIVRQDAGAVKSANTSQQAAIGGINPCSEHTSHGLPCGYCHTNAAQAAR